MNNINGFHGIGWTQFKCIYHNFSHMKTNCHSHARSISPKPSPSAVSSYENECDFLPHAKTYRIWSPRHCNIMYRSWREVTIFLTYFNITICYTIRLCHKNCVLWMGSETNYYIPWPIWPPPQNISKSNSINDNTNVSKLLFFPLPLPLNYAKFPAVERLYYSHSIFISKHTTNFTIHPEYIFVENKIDLKSMKVVN